MNYWLMKSEPNSYSIDSLIRAPHSTDHWEGVRNYQARNFMNQMKVGDQAFFYHSSCEVPGIVGIVKISKESQPDLTALDPNSHYYDPRSTLENPRWFMVDVQFSKKFKKIIPLSMLKTQSALQDLVLLKTGNRLSIMPISKKEWDFIVNLERELN